ncbi:hypothetical protein UAJ10_29160 [Nitrospirillum sp. BR 11164]|uniref:hypothetical protein n=1 Tax=Nitrospirillum sp. BR 11164 TaxID=3104324 RepID=UPI002AFF7671|nr:hypothetical protein [Nitrospirillum sp. BR 11164]MEA1653072.1 hypothetical protein [Nitrospirillum sp. BR 11164]
MEIHAPESPIQSLKDFAIHIGVVTVGILIALGLEQAVEAYHRHELARQAVESFHAELAENRKAVREVLDEIAGHNTRAEEDIALLTAWQQGKGTAGTELKYPGIRLDLMSSASWDAAIATQALGELPYDAVRRYAEAYAGFRLFTEQEKAQLAEWQDMRLFGTDPAQMTATQRQTLIERLRHYQNYVIVLTMAGKGALTAADRALEVPKGPKGD